MKKQRLIKEIKKMFDQLGQQSITMADMQSDHSPVAGSMGRNIWQLVETLRKEDVESVVYVHDMASDWIDMSYEDLSQECLEDIHELLEYHQVAQGKLYDSIRDENF